MVRGLDYCFSKALRHREVAVKKVRHHLWWESVTDLDKRLRVFATRWEMMISQKVEDSKQLVLRHLFFGFSSFDVSEERANHNLSTFSVRTGKEVSQYWSEGVLSKKDVSVEDVFSFIDHDFIALAFWSVVELDNTFDCVLFRHSVPLFDSQSFPYLIKPVLGIVFDFFKVLEPLWTFRDKSRDQANSKHALFLKDFVSRGVNSCVILDHMMWILSFQREFINAGILAARDLDLMEWSQDGVCLVVSLRISFNDNFEFWFRWLKLERLTLTALGGFDTSWGEIWTGTVGCPFEFGSADDIFKILSYEELN